MSNSPDKPRTFKKLIAGLPVIDQVLYRILRPLVKILVVRGVTAQRAFEVLKRVYVETVEVDCQIPGKRMSASRIAIMTGLNRTEVARIRSLDGIDDESEAGWKTHNRAAAVVSAWVRDSQFHDADGEWADLPMEGESKSFSALVKMYAKGVTPYAVLDELLRAGTVKQLRDGEVRLIDSVYSPHKNDEQLLIAIAKNIELHLKSIEHNLGAPKEERFLEQAVKYPSIPPQSTEEFKQYSREKIMLLLREFDEWLNEHRTSQGSGDDEIIARRRAGVGVGFYYFDEHAED